MVQKGAGMGGPASLGRMLSSGDKMHLPWLHLVDENIMPIACAARGLLCKHVEFIWTRTAVSEITARNTVLYSRNT